MKKRILIHSLLLIVLNIAFNQASAQCAMCKTIVDTGTKNGSTVAAGLNMGILYLLVVPFMAISTFSFAFWRRWKATQKKAL